MMVPRGGYNNCLDQRRRGSLMRVNFSLCQAARGKDIHVNTEHHGFRTIWQWKYRSTYWNLQEQGGHNLTQVHFKCYWEPTRLQPCAARIWLEVDSFVTNIYELGIMKHKIQRERRPCKNTGGGSIGTTHTWRLEKEYQTESSNIPQRKK